MNTLSTEPVKATVYKVLPVCERVRWVDHFANHARDVFTAKEIVNRTQEDFVCENIGFLVHEDERKVILSPEARVDVDLDEPLFSHYSVILKVCIIERARLSVVRGG